eukprot:7212441-Heterocapsa_arctica.AAC.1
MGCSWAFCLAQAAHKDMIKRYTDVDEDDFLEIGRPAPKLTSIRPRMHAYCDDLTAFGTDAKQ